MEPTHQLWLYNLTAAQRPAAMAGSSGQDRNLGFSRNFHWVSRNPVSQRFQYSVSSYLDYRLEPEPLPRWRRRQEVQLPGGGNPRSREMARRWLLEAGSEQAYINRLLKHYRDSFTYTLQPPALGRHSVDEFLWKTQRGFCEHFSSSFVFMLRAAGIPARVVAGYQGGEYNAEEKYLTVHQYDAHAWSEVWLSGRGWVRVDPTAAVAPERVEQGLATLEPVGDLCRCRIISILTSQQLAP